MAIQVPLSIHATFLLTNRRCQLDIYIYIYIYGHGSKLMVPFWGFRATTHFRTNFHVGIGMFTGVRGFDAWPYVPPPLFVSKVRSELRRLGRGQAARLMGTNPHSHNPKGCGAKWTWNPRICDTTKICFPSLTPPKGGDSREITEVVGETPSDPTTLEWNEYLQQNGRKSRACVGPKQEQTVSQETAFMAGQRNTCQIQREAAAHLVPKSMASTLMQAMTPLPFGPKDLPKAEHRISELSSSSGAQLDWRASSLSCEQRPSPNVCNRVQKNPKDHCTIASSTWRIG